jgi:hypothetical protein
MSSAVAEKAGSFTANSLVNFHFCGFEFVKKPVCIILYELVLKLFWGGLAGGF